MNTIYRTSCNLDAEKPDAEKGMKIMPNTSKIASSRVVIQKLIKSSSGRERSVECGKRDRPLQRNTRTCHRMQGSNEEG